MANKHGKDKFGPTSHYRKQFKTIVRFLSVPPLRMAVIKKAANTCEYACRQKQTLIHCWWECELSKHRFAIVLLKKQAGFQHCTGNPCTPKFIKVLSITANSQNHQGG